MELFTILCETCAAKLKVTRPNAVGQKLACPKCNNMLQVVPPPGWKLSPELKDSLSEDDITKLNAYSSSSQSFDDIDDILAKPIDKILAKPVLHQSPVGMPERKKPKRKPLPTLDADNAEKKPDPILPTGQWTSPESRARRKHLLIGGSIIGAILIAGSIVTAFVVNRNNVAKKNDTPVVNDEPIDIPIPTADKIEEPEEVTAIPGDAETSPNPDEEDIDTPATNSVSSTDLPPEIPTGDPPTVPDSSTDVPTTPDAPPEIPDEEDKAGIPTNPLAGLLDGDDTPLKKRDELIDRDVFGNPLQDNSTLGDLSALLNQSNSSIREIRDLAESIRDEESIGIAKYYVEKPDSIEIDPSKLDLSCGGIIYKDISLLTMLREITAITGVPFAFDSSTCQASNFDFKTTVEVRMQQKDGNRVNFAMVVDSVLKDLQLDGTTKPECIVLSPIGSKKSTVAEYPLPGFAKELSDEMIEFIKAMIGPQTWDNEEQLATIALEGNVITVQQTPVFQVQIKEFIDRLSCIHEFKGPQIELANQPTLATRWTSAKPLLEKLPAMERTLPLPLEEYCSSLERSTGLTVLIDWPSLVREGWHPQTMVPGSIDEPTVLETVKELAKAMKATFRVVNADTVEITTFEAATAQSELEIFYYGDLVPNRFSQEQLVTLINRTLSREFKSNPNVRMDFVPHLKCIVSVAPQSLQRQLELVMNTLRGL